MPDRTRILIVGGGIAGVEALLALADQAGELAEITLLSPEPELTYRPALVDEPFTLEPPDSYSLEGIATDVGAGFVLDALASIDPERSIATCSSGSELSFDVAVICVGGRLRRAFSHGITFFDREGPAKLRSLLRDLDGNAEASKLAFVVPSGASWTLPLYELALMSAEVAARISPRPELTIVTPEAAPLVMFGWKASDAVGELLEARGIEVVAGEHARETEAGEIHLSPGDQLLDCDQLIALPLLEGPQIDGLPAGERGFIPIDEYARVPGCPNVFAAGDGTTFPIKQGGLGAQAADVAASQIAAGLGAPVEPKAFHPILRGKLFVGAESLYLQHDPTGGGGEGTVSSDYLWWPPHKVSGRYLASWIAGTEPQDPTGGPEAALEVELALPKQWHSDPMALDPYDALPSD